MRAVADSLDVTPMALYHHVKDKAALAALVIDSAIRNNPLPGVTGVWQDDMYAVAKWMRDINARHPVMARLRREFNVWTPSMLRMTERWFSLWQQSGLPLDKAKLAATTSSMAITGLVNEESLYRTMKLPNAQTLKKTPNASALFEGDHDREKEFELVVRALIAGLHERLSSQPEIAKPAAKAKSNKQNKP